LPFFGGRKAADITTTDITRYIVRRQAGASQEAIAKDLKQIQEHYVATIESIQESGLGKREVRKRVGQAKQEWKRASAEAKGKAGAANATVNRELSLLRRALTLAVQSKKLVTKAHVPLLSENNVRTGFFELDQFNAVLKHLPDHVKPVARFAYITGWRANSEILTLQWRQVDFQAGTVSLDPGTTKNMEDRVFPMTSDLRVLLMEQKPKALQREQQVLCPWVFTYQGKPVQELQAGQADGTEGRRTTRKAAA